LGGEPADFDYLRAHPRANPYFDAIDGRCHLCYVGTLLPLGFETLRTVLTAARLLRSRRPELYQRLRIHFFGTSNQRAQDAPQRVLPVARELEVADCVTEVAPRIDYLDALMVQVQASAILLMGSSERHYTASKLYPALLAKRPLLAAYHEASSVVEILRAHARPPSVRLVTYGDATRAEAKVEEMAAALAAIVESPAYEADAVNLDGLAEFSARTCAGKLALLLERLPGRA
jgi:hypothetical protein